MNRSVNCLLTITDGRYPAKQFRRTQACRPFVVVGSRFKPHSAPCAATSCSVTNFSVHGCRVTPRHRAPQNQVGSGTCQYVKLRRHHLADCFPRLCDFSTTNARRQRHTRGALDRTCVHQRTTAGARFRGRPLFVNRSDEALSFAPQLAPEFTWRACRSGR